jgi:hypothetical protein
MLYLTLLHCSFFLPWNLISISPSRRLSNNTATFYYRVIKCVLPKRLVLDENNSNITRAKHVIRNNFCLFTCLRIFSNNRYPLYTGTCGTYCMHTITYPGFAWVIRRVLYLMIEFIGPLYNWLQQFTNHYLTHCPLLRLDTLDFWPHFTNSLLRCTPYRLPTVPSVRTPRKTPSSVFKNTCFLVRYLAMDVLLLLSSCVLGCVYWVVA